MADIFTVTAPLLLRLPDGTQRVLAEVFRHPEGPLYFDIYRERLPGDAVIHLLAGEIQASSLSRTFS